MNRSKKSWKLLVLVALLSSFIFCSEVCATNCVKDAKAAPKEEVKEAEEAKEVAEAEEAKEVAEAEEVKEVAEEVEEKE